MPGPHHCENVIQVANSGEPGDRRANAARHHEPCRGTTQQSGLGYDEESQDRNNTENHSRCVVTRYPKDRGQRNEMESDDDDIERRSASILKNRL